MGSFYTRDHTAGDHIHTDIRTCNTEAPKQKYPLERSIKDYWGARDDLCAEIAASDSLVRITS